MKKIPTGISDFKKLIEDEYMYIDKTTLVKKLLDDGSQVFLFPRPRRFGKTLTMSMLDRYFNVEYKEEKDLFYGLKINNQGEEYLKHKNKYPVIFISLKDIKPKTWEEAKNKLKQIIAEMYEKKIYIYDSLYEHEKKVFMQIINKEADISEYENALKNLTKYLERYYGEKVIVLIDEYDGVIENSFLEEYYDDCIRFLRALLSSGLKDNTALKFGVLTGILRVSQEGILSELNNLTVYNVLSTSMEEFFGFTEKEVEESLAKYNLEDKLEQVKLWYNGYKFGNIQIYNPWSIINFLKTNGVFDTYWAKTSSNSLLNRILSLTKLANLKTLQSLIEGEPLKVDIDTDIVYNNLDTQTSLFSFLLMTGYVTTTEKVEETIRTYSVKVPNEEIKIIFKQIILKWINSSNADINTSIVQMLQKNILENNYIEFQENLAKTLLKATSYYDDNESFYHGFMLMLLVTFGDNYEVTSNKEAGFGRYDLLLTKKDKSFAAIFELKHTTRKEREKEIEQGIEQNITYLENLADIAIKQVKENKYYTDVVENGYKNINIYGIGFNTKNVELKFESIV